MSDGRKQKIVCLVGPTAIGKTELSFLLAEALKAEIISADSVQLYRGMDIGSAKPTLEEQKRVRHHLIDCIDISDTSFSVSAYRCMAAQAIDTVVKRGNIPLIVGGSGLYVDSLIKPLNFACPSDPRIRSEIEAEFLSDEPMKAWEALSSIDPPTAKRLHPNDRKRIIRAIEVYRISGKPLSLFGNDFANNENTQGDFDALVFVLETERDRLYARIEKRVDVMMENGLEDEVRQLYEGGFDLKYTPMQSLGYKQMIEYFEGVRSLDETVAKIKIDTRHFAKRQISWFNRYADAIRVPINDDTSLFKLAGEMANTIKQWEDLS